MSRDADVEDVLAAALRRAQALVNRDKATLTELHHPDLRWTTFRGAVLDSVELKGVAETFSLRLTQTWVRAPAGWRCLSGHAGPRLRTA